MSSTSYKKKHLKTYTVRVYHNSNGAKTGVELKATWRFSGTYSGVSIGTITAKTTVDLNTIDATTAAVQATQNANTATENANAATDAANVATQNADTATESATAAAEAARAAATAVGDEIDGIVIKDTTNSVDYIAKLRLIDGKPAIEYVEI